MATSAISKTGCLLSEWLTAETASEGDVWMAGLRDVARGTRSRPRSRARSSRQAGCKDSSEQDFSKERHHTIKKREQASQVFKQEAVRTQGQEEDPRVQEGRHRGPIFWFR